MTHDDREHLCEIDQTAEPCLARGQPIPATEHPLFANAPFLELRPGLGVITADDLRNACSRRRR